ncbi:MAG: hypothetical protein K2K23_08515 [Muribaculaceae bacterium]|nr:hypothetical protein [Muribaculaceae bacterium]
MKKIIIFLMLCVCAMTSMAQVPNFGTTVGDQKLYGYSALKYRAKANSWETYSTLQYGITNYMQIGADLYTATDNAFIGYTVRAGYKFSNYFKLGAQITPSFDLNDHHKFSYLTSGIYMNGNITRDGKLFWVTDTWLENNKKELTSAKQWTYLGYTFSLPGNSNSITPMAGVIHSWKFDQDPDLSFGAYYTHKNISLYVWTNDILTSRPRFVAAVEFAFSNK